MSEKRPKIDFEQIETNNSPKQQEVPFGSMMIENTEMLDSQQNGGAESLIRPCHRVN